MRFRHTLTPVDDGEIRRGAASGSHGQNGRSLDPIVLHLTALIDGE